MKKIYLIRHGETEWTISRQHTGTTDIPLTENGKRQAELLAKRLKGHKFDAVYTSPLRRALQTCEIAGFKHAVLMPDLREWNYGAYEGITSKEIHVDNPSWNIFEQGGPGGESPQAIENRIDRLIENILKNSGDIALFSHGHFLRAFAMRFIGLPIVTAKHFALFPASLSILNWEKTLSTISLWNAIEGL